MKDNQSIINTQIAYRVIGKCVNTGSVYHVCSDFESLSKAIAYKNKYCGRAINTKNDTFFIIKLVPELI